jgi:hypothetical protein
MPASSKSFVRRFAPPPHRNPPPRGGRESEGRHSYSYFLPPCGGGLVGVPTRCCIAWGDPRWGVATGAIVRFFSPAALAALTRCG